ncbi:MAG: hypothetical protein KKB30_08350 [Proteobacteria bacterium]|nr:hypothetical protein [Pseudomonadota bacterium]MBU1714831.1 hypothetical protein [Pseudomonadota bacterium]
MNTYFEKTTAWDRIMMAITFAEAGETITACSFLDQKKPEARIAKRAENRPEVRV